MRGKLPIIGGGTGLYIDSLVNNIKFTQSPTDNELRVKLQMEVEEMCIRDRKYGIYITVNRNSAGCISDSGFKLTVEYL